MSPTSSDIAIASAYNEWAESYDADANQTRDLAGLALRATELGITGQDVVEIGCGTGRNTIWLAEHAASVLALDFSEGMLSHARRRLDGKPQVRFTQHDVRMPWPLADKSADVAVAILVLEHVEHLEQVFKEAYRILRAGGRVFICELHPMRQLLGGQAQFTRKATGERELVTAFIHDVSDYVNSAVAAGFSLNRMDEWRDANASATSPPRLLSLCLNKR